MGSTDSITYNNSLQFNRNNWVYVSGEEHSDKYIKGIAGRKIKNRMTGEQLDEYELYITDEESRRQFNRMLQYRNKNEHLIQIVHINSQIIYQFCSLIYYLKVYIEPIPIRMNEIKQIRFPQNLYLLSRMFQGFLLLYKQIGNFYIHQHMICVNQEGIVKVWGNQNLAMSSIQKNKYLNTINRNVKNICYPSQNSMVWQIINMVDKITIKQSIPNQYTFIQFIKSIKNSKINFKKAIKLLNIYKNKMGRQIPEVLFSIIKIIRQKKGIVDSQIDVNQHNYGKCQWKKFKQSKVERMSGFHSQFYNRNKSLRTSQSNNTIADRLKKKNTTANLPLQMKKDQSAILLLDHRQIKTQRAYPHNFILSNTSIQHPHSLAFDLRSRFMSYSGPLQTINGFSSPNIISNKLINGNIQLRKKPPQLSLDLVRIEERAVFNNLHDNTQMQNEQEITDDERLTTRNEENTIQLTNNTYNEDRKGYLNKPQVTFSYLNQLHPFIFLSNNTFQSDENKIKEKQTSQSFITDSILKNKKYEENNHYQLKKQSYIKNRSTQQDEFMDQKSMQKIKMGQLLEDKKKTSKVQLTQNQLTVKSETNKFHQNETSKISNKYKVEKQQQTHSLSKSQQLKLLDKELYNISQAITQKYLKVVPKQSILIQSNKCQDNNCSINNQSIQDNGFWLDPVIAADLCKFNAKKKNLISSCCHTSQ